MVGRAGRAGKSETGDSILICSTRDYQMLKNLLCSKMDETVSGFMNDLSGKFMRTVVQNLLKLTFFSEVLFTAHIFFLVKVKRVGFSKKKWLGFRKTMIFLKNIFLASLFFTFAFSSS
jgi:replicative superfamily II helicase